MEAALKKKVGNGDVPDSQIYRDNSGNFFELVPVKPGDLQRILSKDNSFQITVDSDTSSFESENIVYKMQDSFAAFMKDYQKPITRLILLLLLAGYTVYFAFAINYSVDMAVALIVITGLVVFCIVYAFIRDHFGKPIYDNCIHPVTSFLSEKWFFLKWIIYPGLMIATVLYLALDVVTEVRQLQSLTGFVFFILIMYITSVHPDKIQWRPVIWGFALQFLLAILVLRWKYGYVAVKFLADEITKFIQYGYAGAAVVFGDPFLVLHPFAFMGMPILIYLGAVMALLFHLGITQLVVRKMGWLVQVTMGTTAIESLNTTANIFLDGMDTMLLLRYYIDKLTKSEFNCFVVGNHATVAGFVFALFVLFGAPPQHLLSAAVMSAPATIAICKLHHPETEESDTKFIDDVELDKGDDVNVFEAAANGAAVAAKTVAAVVSCYIAFMSLLAFINVTLSWLGGRVGYEELSFELICSYIMWPIAYIIGIDYSECQESAKLIGIKLFATEILAYQELGKSVAAGRLTPRSQALTTYAMCGFSSISTLAIAVGVWNSICPQRVKEMASHMFRFLVQANISCFMTACVAGLFYSSEVADEFDKGEDAPIVGLIKWILALIPSYKQLMGLVGM